MRLYSIARRYNLCDDAADCRSTRPDRSCAAAPSAQAGVAEGTCARRRDLPQPEEAGARAEVAYGVRERQLPQPGRVLEPKISHLHDAGQPMHSALRLLRGAQGQAGADRPGRAEARCIRRGAAWTGPCGGDQRQSRRRQPGLGARLCGGGARDSLAGAGLPRRGADAGLSGQRRVAAHCGGGAAGDPEPQHRDRSAAVCDCKVGRKIHALAGVSAAGQGACGGGRPHAGDQDWHHRRHGRGDARAAGGLPRPGRAAGGHPDHRAVSAAQRATIW